MKSRLSFLFVILMVLMTGFGGFILLLGIRMWDVFFTIDRAKYAWALGIGALLITLGSMTFWGLWQRLTTLEIDPLTGNVTIRPLLGKHHSWSRPQIHGYTTGSVYAKLVTTEAIYLHITDREPLMLIALGTRNFAAMKALIIHLYPPMTPPPSRKRRPLSHAEEVRRRFNQGRREK